MVTVSNTVKNEPWLINGLSTDQKPTTIREATGGGPNETLPNGSWFIEMDTSAIYLFDAQNSLWRPFDA